MSEPRSNATPKRAWKKRGLALFLVFLAGAGLAVWVMGVFDQEPRYQGRPASYWLDLACKGTNVDEAFKAMGSNVAPFLARALERKPSSLDEKLSDLRTGRYEPEVLRKHFLEKVVRIIEGRIEAARLLSELGPDAEPALPVLLRIFREGDERELVQTYVNNTLIAMGDRIAFMVPELLQNLTNNQPHIRVLCAQMLGSIGPKAKPAVPALLQATESSDWGGWLALSAGKALMSIDGQTNVALRVLTNALKHTNSTMRQFALMDLRKLGPAAKVAASPIGEALKDSDFQVREEAEKTLKELDPAFLERRLRYLNEQTGANIAHLIETIRSGTFRDAFAAIEVIPIYGPEAKAAVPVLIEKLNQQSLTNLPSQVVNTAMAGTALRNWRRHIAEALAEIGPDARPAVPALVELLSDSGDYNGSFYCKALGRIGPDAQAATPVLRKVLANGNPGLRLASAVALTRIDPQQAAPAIQALQDFRGNPEQEFQILATVALWKLNRQNGLPLARLIDLVREPVESWWAAELLGDLELDAKEAIPALTDMLRRDSNIDRRKAAIAIRRIDPQAATRLGLPGMLAVP